MILLMGDSEEEYFEDSVDDRVSQATEACLAMKPEMVKNGQACAVKTRSLRSKLNKVTVELPKQKSSRLDERKLVEDQFKDVLADFSTLQKGLATLKECMSSIFDRLEEVERRLEAIESKPANTYSEALTSTASVQEAGERLSRLEYKTSETERAARLLDISITHPSLDNTRGEMVAHVQNFLSVTLKMDNREIDANLQVKKVPRPNTVLIRVSHTRFKRFIYTARKKLRQEDESSTNDLYINDDLTNYNYKILKQLKAEKRRRQEQHLPNFNYVYSFEGKIFVKKLPNTPSSDAIYVSSPSSLDNFLSKLGQTPLEP